jgi:hypothetical protein
MNKNIFLEIEDDDDSFEFSSMDFDKYDAHLDQAKADFEDKGYLEKICIEFNLNVNTIKKDGYYNLIFDSLFADMYNNMPLNGENIFKIYEGMTNFFSERLTKKDEKRKYNISHKFSLNESDNITKKDIENIVDKKNYITKNEVEKLIKNMIVKQYKIFWEKKSFYINDL